MFSKTKIITHFITVSTAKNAFTSLVKLDYKQLIGKQDLSKQIGQAFGEDGLGLIVIKNIPNFLESRNKLLKDGFTLANLPKDHLSQLEMSELNYTIGWSLGKSYTDRVRDEMLGCFYQTTYFDKRYDGVWPASSIPEFKQNFQRYCQITANTQRLFLQQMSHYVQEIFSDYKAHTLYQACFDKEDPICNPIGRLLTYHPYNWFNYKIEDNQAKWIGWHRDVAILTALPCPMYINANNGQQIEGIGNGLLVRDRKGQIHKINYNEDEIIIQAGDLAFILSGGNIIATPHCVQPAKETPKDVFRITISLFMEPHENYKIKIPHPLTAQELFQKDPFQLANVLTNWTGECTFGEFLGKAQEKVYSSH